MSVVDEALPTGADGTCTFGIDPRRDYLVSNQTPRVIRVYDGRGDELVLSPLSKRVVCGHRLVAFEASMRLLRQRHQLGVRDYTKPRQLCGVSVMLSALAFFVAMVVAIDVVRYGTLLTWEALAALAVTVTVIVCVVLKAGHVETDRVEAEAHADKREGDIEYGIGGAYYDGNETMQRLKYTVTLLAVVTIGAVLPAIAIFVATDAKDFLVMHGGLHVTAGKESRLVSRLIQVTYTAVLSLFPALLYFQFDRQRVGTIRKSWIRAIFRMDQRMETMADVNARYGEQISEASTYSTDSVRLLGGRHSPIIVATILISLGWTLLVLRTESYDFAAASKVSTLARSVDDAADRAQNAASAGATEAASSAADLAAQASKAAVDVVNGSTSLTSAPGLTTTPATTATTQSDAAAAQQDAAAATGAANAVAAVQATVDQPFFQLLVPTPSAATMAFLGAYFFAVYLILRGYFRGDLRPKAYNQITARLVTVVVLAYLMNVLFFSDTRDNTWLWAAAFLAGVVPTTMLRRVGVLASAFAPTGGTKTSTTMSSRKTRRRNACTQVFATPRLLTQIDGVDLQEASRLESEGYPDVTSLARSDLVFVMVNTRLPIEHLVDWTDQAVLILLLEDGVQDELDQRVIDLRRAGVRTATAILTIAERPTADPARMRVADIVCAGNSGLTLDSLVQLIKHEPAMGRIQQWYNSEVADVARPLPCIIGGTGPEVPSNGNRANGSGGDGPAAAHAPADPGDPDGAAPAPGDA